MLVCKLELWKKGNPNDKVDYGTVFIANDGKGTLDQSDYDVVLMKVPALTKNKKGGIWKKGRILNFSRRKRGPYDLLYTALRELLAERNPIEIS